MKKILFTLVALFISFFTSFSLAAPSFGGVRSDSIGGYESLGVNRDTSLENNIRKIFFPDLNDGGAIWRQLQPIFVGLLLLFVVRSGVMFAINANNETELKKSKMNLIYIFLAAFLIFGAMWIVGGVLKVGQSSTDATVVALGTQNKLIGGILIFLKAFAYYLAIMLVIYYGYKIMQGQEKEDKIKAGRNGVINVILALIAIKVLDYIYFIAQTSDFRGQASSLISSAGNALGWGLGIIVILALVYAGFLLISSKGNEEKMKKSKTIIRNVFIVIFIVFLFLVIVYDLVKNFSN